MTRAWRRCLVVARLATVAGVASGCVGDTTGPTPMRRPELIFAEVDTGSFTTRLMGYSALEGIWELAPGEANLPQPTQYWYLRPTTGEVLYSGVLADLARGTYTAINSPTLDAIGPAEEWAPRATASWCCFWMASHTGCSTRGAGPLRAVPFRVNPAAAHPASHPTAKR